MNQTTQAKSITVVVDAFSTGDFDDGPSYAAFVVNGSFIARIKAVQLAAEQLDLSHAAVNAYPEQWGPGVVEDSLRLKSSELFISKDGYFYFEATPKYGSVIQSRGQELSHIETAYDEAGDGDIFYLGDQPEVKEMYLEDLRVPA